MSSTQFIGFESIMVILEVSMLLWQCRTFQVYFCHFTLGGGLGGHFGAFEGGCFKCSRYFGQFEGNLVILEF